MKFICIRTDHYPIGTVIEGEFDDGYIFVKLVSTEFDDESMVLMGLNYAPFPENLALESQEVFEEL